MTDTTTLSLKDIHELACTVLLAHGFSNAQAHSIADTVTAAERDGCRSHGLFRIAFYIAALKNPHAAGQAEPVLDVSESAVVHVDAMNGFCPLALQRGLPVLAEKAERFGIAALAIHNTYNIAALWPEVEWLAEKGLVGFAFTTSNAYVAPAGGSSPVYGTNPMAFGFPREAEPPLVFDQASSASARGEIQLHRRDNRLLPDGWAIDIDGQPTNDPGAALEGAQLPFGGYKGASLALMVELLAGALIGDNLSMQSSAQDTHKVGAPFGGELVLALSPGSFNNGGHLQQAEMLFTQILSQPGTRLPSQRRYQVRQQSTDHGVDVQNHLLADLNQLKAGSD